MSLRREVDPEQNAERALDDVVDAVLEDSGKLKQALWKIFEDVEGYVDADNMMEFICDTNAASDSGVTLQDALRAKLEEHLMDSDAHLERIAELNEQDAEDADYLRDQARDDRLVP